MPELRVDRGKCQGHAMCYGVEPDLFPLDDDGYCAVTSLLLDESQVAPAQRGVAACPERAIEVLE